MKTSCFPVAASLRGGDQRYVARVERRAGVEYRGHHRAHTPRPSVSGASGFSRPPAGRRSLGYDHSLRRMWGFYLAYVEGGFRERRIGDVQLLLAGPAHAALPAPDALPPRWGRLAVQWRSCAFGWGRSSRRTTRRAPLRHGRLDPARGHTGGAGAVGPRGPARPRAALPPPAAEAAPARGTAACGGRAPRARGRAPLRGDPAGRGAGRTRASSSRPLRRPRTPTWARRSPTSRRSRAASR